MTRIAVIAGSTRTYRRCAAVAQWTFETARQTAKPEVEFELVDLADFNLPVLDEPAPAAWGNDTYTNDHTKRWAGTPWLYSGVTMMYPSKDPMVWAR